jgi:hypothetical protein
VYQNVIYLNIKYNMFQIYQTLNVDNSVLYF